MWFKHPVSIMMAIQTRRYVACAALNTSFLPLGVANAGCRSCRPCLEEDVAMEKVPVDLFQMWSSQSNSPL